MKDNTTYRKLLTLSLVARLTLPLTVMGIPASNQLQGEPKAPPKPKLAPDLEEILA